MVKLSEAGPRIKSKRMGELPVSLEIEQPQPAAMERNYKISRNEFFITVAALAI